VKFGRVVFEICEWTDGQTDTQIATPSTKNASITADPTPAAHALGPTSTSVKFRFSARCCDIHETVWFADDIAAVKSTK